MQFDYNKIIKEFEAKTEPEKVEALRRYEVARKYMAISIAEIASDLGMNRAVLAQYMRARIERRKWIGVKQVNPHERYTLIAKSILKRVSDKIEKVLQNVNSK